MQGMVASISFGPEVEAHPATWALLVSRFLGATLVVPPFERQ